MAESAETKKLSGLAQSIDALFAAPPAAAPHGSAKATPTPIAPPAAPPEEAARSRAAETQITPPPARAARPPVPERRPEMFPASQMLDTIKVEELTATPPPPRPVAAEPAGGDLDLGDALALIEVPTEESPMTFGDPPPSLDDIAPPGTLTLVDAVVVPADPSTPPPLPTFEVEPVFAAPPPLPTLDEPPAAVAPPPPPPRTSRRVSAGPPPLPTLEGERVAAPARAPAPKAETGDETDPRALRAAVDAHLAGEPDARDLVERIAAGLRERLVLDPVADAVETLVIAAGDPPDQRMLDVASAAINPAVASRLVQRMGQELDGARREEYFALCRRMGRVMANAVKGALTGATQPEVRRVYYDALLSMGETSRPVIEAMLEDENRFLVRAAVAMLGEIGGERAVQLVTSALADTDPRVRAEALLSLAKIGEEEAGQLVLASFDDTDPTVRRAAAAAAGELKIGRALRPLLQMLEGQPDAELCQSVLRALGQIGDPGAVHAIEKHAVPSLFYKPETNTRIVAYRALHQIGTPHARDLINQAARDKDPGVRMALRDIATGI